MKKLYIFLMAIFLLNIANAQWIPLTNMYHGAIYGLVLKGSNIFCATSYGVYESTDNGITWIDKNAGLPEYVEVFTIATDGVNLYAGTSGYGVYISNNNGSSWSASNTGLSNLAVGHHMSVVQVFLLVHIVDCFYQQIMELIGFLLVMEYPVIAL